MKIDSNFWIHKKVLITGGAGFIGTHFNKHLVTKRLAHVTTTIHKQKLQWTNDQLKYRLTDLTKKEDCILATKGIDVLIHCAAESAGASVMTHNPLSLITDNLLMTIRLLEAAALNGVKYILLLSSSTVYPDSPEPMREEDGFVGDPASCYFGIGWVKRYEEKLCEFYRQQYKMHICILRPAHVIGEYMNFDPEESHMVPALIQRALAWDGEGEFVVWGSPEVVRDYLDANDFVDLACDLLPRESGVMNLGRGVSVKTSEMVEEILTHTARFQRMGVGKAENKQVHYDASKPTMIPIRRIDIGKFRQRNQSFIFTPPTQTVKRIVDWYWSKIHAEDGSAAPSAF